MMRALLLPNLARLGLMVTLFGLLLACAPTGPNADPAGNDADAAVQSDAADSAPTTQPPEAAPRDAPGEVDFSCTVDADCAVKNVGNCCGYYPACVNANSPTFPEQVMTQCQREGMSSICGFPEISACQCVEGRCAPGGEGLRLD